MSNVSRTRAATGRFTSIAAATAITALLIGGCTRPAASSPGAGKRSGQKVTADSTALRVLSVSPAQGATGVNGTEPIRVVYSGPLSASTPFPRLSPAIAGTWQREGDTAVFTPAVGFPAGTHVTVSTPEPGGARGSVRGGGTGHADGASSPVASFTTAHYSTLRLEQVLAQLGYLPLSWTPVLGSTVTPGSAARQLAAAYTPPVGTFSWSSGYPGQMYGFWKQGSANLLLTGAITGFEADHGLTTDGQASPAVWAALLKAAAAGQRDPHGYSYAVASESSPETLTIWHDGRQVFSSVANTGQSAAPTAQGTFYVYEKLPFQIMSGTNPGGSHYSDPVEWVSYFNGGDAVHYYPRGSYGYPQSDGCVELPYSAAKQAYPLMPYGTLVSVVG